MCDCMPHMLKRGVGFFLLNGQNPLSMTKVICRLSLNQISFMGHRCSNHLNLEMEAKCLKKTLSYLNLNISRTKNCRNKL